MRDLRPAREHTLGRGPRRGAGGGAGRVPRQGRRTADARRGEARPGAQGRRPTDGAERDREEARGDGGGEPVELRGRGESEARIVQRTAARSTPGGESRPKAAPPAPTRPPGRRFVAASASIRSRR